MAPEIFCRIYLVGGTTVVALGLREQTIDIDLAYEIDNAHHAKLIEAIRRLKEELNLKGTSKNPVFVIPAQAGIQQRPLDSRWSLPRGFPLSRE